MYADCERIYRLYQPATKLAKRKKGCLMIDADGYRENVAIVLLNEHDQVLWCRRVGGQDAWQFPQGGMQQNETPEQAMYRELDEEVGLQPNDVCVVGRTEGWLRYDLPDAYVRKNVEPVCVGQKQIWFLLRLNASERCLDLNKHDTPEFDHWCWVDYDYPVDKVVDFKRDVYQQALAELKPLLASA